MVNTDSGKSGKVFTLNQNECSRSAGIGVHVEPEWVFMMGRNMQVESMADSYQSFVLLTILGTGSMTGTSFAACFYLFYQIGSFSIA
jgi:hypothetical protein